MNNLVLGVREVNCELNDVLVEFLYSNEIQHKSEAAEKIARTNDPSTDFVYGTALLELACYDYYPYDERVVLFDRAATVLGEAKEASRPEIDASNSLKAMIELADVAIKRALFLDQVVPAHEDLINQYNEAKKCTELAEDISSEFHKGNPIRYSLVGIGAEAAVLALLSRRYLQGTAGSEGIAVHSTLTQDMLPMRDSHDGLKGNWDVSLYVPENRGFFEVDEPETRIQVKHKTKSETLAPSVTELSLNGLSDSNKRVGLDIIAQNFRGEERGREAPTQTLDTLTRKLQAILADSRDMTSI